MFFPANLKGLELMEQMSCKDTLMDYSDFTAKFVLIYTTYTVMRTNNS